MAILNYPIWTFEPNWSNSVTETLEWSTEILTSPTGSEQRRSLRAFPRIEYEFAVAAEGVERQYLDQMLINHGSAKWYLPLFYEAGIMEQAVAPGEQFLMVDVADLAWIRPGAIVCIMDGRPRNIEMAEVIAVTGSAIMLLEPLKKPWGTGTLVCPCVVAELTDQPELTMRTASLATAEVRFRLAAMPDFWTFHVQQDPADGGLTRVYEGFQVCLAEPDWTENPKLTYERQTVEMDNDKNYALRRDTAARAFSIRESYWTLMGRAAHDQFRAMLSFLRGRARPVWVPTFLDDFNVIEPLAKNSNLMRVAFNGYQGLGGPRADREHVMIMLANGTVLFRQIIGASTVRDQLTLVLSAAFPANFSVSQVVRVSFMALSRLNHDSIAIDHQTDTMGVSKVRATFRSAPNTRSGPEAYR